jgi:ClpP class serine protease
MIYQMDPGYLADFLSAVASPAKAAIEDFSRPGVIPVQGALVPKERTARAYRDWGISATSYESISLALKQAGGSPVTFEINSGGGLSEGVDALMKEIYAYEGKKTAVVSGTAASAAYGIASQCDSIIASDEGDLIGSVGVAIDAYVSSQLISISSTEAPNKRPDLTTEEGKSVVRITLDQIHELFVEQIAKGRGITPEKVNSDYGRGGVLTARHALKAKMIDSIGKGANQEKEKEKMEKNQEWACAHLTLGDACGDILLAVQAIRDGRELDATMHSEYMAAQLRANKIQQRAAEDASAETSARAVAEDDFWGPLLKGDE